jgi:EAL domain-containing protein (putative c-di-GMP-specific phosphodiesterase class I)
VVNRERQRLEAELHRALERDEFILHYQPKINLRTGEVTGVEALVRWRHPKLGAITPDRFIPLAEETGLIVPIGEWVMRTACRQARRWRDAGLPSVGIAVNLSARQFRLQGLTDLVKDVLRETGLNLAGSNWS